MTMKSYRVDVRINIDTAVTVEAESVEEAEWLAIEEVNAIGLNDLPVLDCHTVALEAVTA